MTKMTENIRYSQQDNVTTTETNYLNIYENAFTDSVSYLLNLYRQVCPNDCLLEMKESNKQLSTMIGKTLRNLDHLEQHYKNHAARVP